MIVLLARVDLVLGPCFSSLWISYARPFWTEVFLLRNQWTALWELFRVSNCFSLAPFKILSLYLTFGILIMMCLGVGLFGFILFGILCAFWTYMSVSFTRLEKFSIIIIFSNKFSIICSVSFSSSIPMMLILVHLKLFQRLFTLSCLFGLFLLF